VRIKIKGCTDDGSPMTGGLCEVWLNGEKRGDVQSVQINASIHGVVTADVRVIVDDLDVEVNADAD